MERTLEAILDSQPCRSWKRDLATPSASSHLLPSFAPYVPAKPIFYFLNKLPQGLCTCSFLYWMNPGSPRLTWLASALHGDFELECHLPEIPLRLPLQVLPLPHGHFRRLCPVWSYLSHFFTALCSVNSAGRGSLSAWCAAASSDPY